MLKNEKQLFKPAAILYLILIVLIYIGSYLKYLLQYSWYGTASVIVILFIWITILMIATVLTARGVFLIRRRNEAKQKLDFAARLGAGIANYRQSGKEPDLLEFYKKICEESGIADAPGLDKYYDNQKNLIEKRELVYLKLKEEIDEAAKLSKKA